MLNRITRIHVWHGRRILAVLIFVLAAGYGWSRARSTPVASVTSTAGVATTAVLQVNTSGPGNSFPPGTVGLSTEASSLKSNNLSASHSSLVHLMRLLGPSVLRVGGNSVDLSWWTSSNEPPPTWATNTVTPTALAELHRLLTVTGWKAILGVDLGHFEPARAADEAHYARDILGNDLLGIEIGNEPDDFGRKTELRPPTYNVGEYLHEASAYGQVLRTNRVRLYGPALGRTEWLLQIGTAARMFTELTLHYYPTSTCTHTGPATAELLLPDVRNQEDETVEGLVRTGKLAGRPTRIGETNAAACTTSPSAGPIFATALWALDWALRAASAGVHGINFQGIFGLCGAHSNSPVCAPNAQAPSVDDVRAQPEYYGILAARQLEGGRFVPTRLTTADPLPNLTTWATLAPNGTVRIAIDNLATEGSALQVSIPTSSPTATVETLIGSSTGAQSNISLGGVPVTSAGHWHPEPTLLDARPRLRVNVPPASAAIITLYPTHLARSVPR